MPDKVFYDSASTTIAVTNFTESFGAAGIAAIDNDFCTNCCERHKNLLIAHRIRQALNDHITAQASSPPLTLFTEHELNILTQRMYVLLNVRFIDEPETVDAP